MLRGRTGTEYETPSRRLFAPSLLLVLLVLLGAFAAGCKGDDKASTPAGRVPAVVGLRSPIAIDRLRERGYVAEQRQRTDPAKSGRVLEQDPEAGADLERGGTVTLVVAHDPAAVGVPDVVGSVAAAAAARVRAAGLRAQTRKTVSAQPEGRVVSQVPAGGDEAKRGSNVLLSVSNGAQLVTVPSASGLTVAKATAMLRRRGLRTMVSRIASPGRPGRVFDQRPKPGARVPKGSAVRLSVSKGGGGPGPGSTNPQPPVARGKGTVPGVVRLSDFEAINRIKAAGFEPHMDPVNSAEPQGLVLSQSPKAGTRAPRGSKVRLTVSGGRTLKTVPNVVGRNEASARQILRRAGYQVTSVDKSVTDPARAGIVVDQDPKGGIRTEGPIEVMIFVGRLA